MLGLFYSEKYSNLVSVIASTECIPCIPKFQETHRGCVLLMFYVRQVDEWITRCKEDMQVYKSIVRCVACVASIKAVKNLHTYWTVYKHLSHTSWSPTSSSFNRSKILTGSVRLLKLSPDPTVAARTGLPTTATAFVVGKSAPEL